MVRRRSTVRFREGAPDNRMRGGVAQRQSRRLIIAESVVRVHPPLLLAPLNSTSPTVDKGTWPPPFAPAARAWSKTRTATASSVTPCRETPRSRRWRISAARSRMPSRTVSWDSSPRLSRWALSRSRNRRARTLRPQPRQRWLRRGSSHNRPGPLAICLPKTPSRRSPHLLAWTGGRHKHPCAGCCRERPAPRTDSRAFLDILLSSNN